MPKRISLVGRTFERLFVFADAPSKGPRAQSWVRCRHCNKEFIVLNGNLTSGNTTGCLDFRCHSFTPEEVLAFFTTDFVQVERGYLTPCFEWSRARDQKNYGKIRFAGKSHYAHRLHWEFRKGAIPAGLFVCHHCDNPPCIRLSHLFLGTAGENILDAARKGRMPRGEANGRAKLTEEQVREIRRLHANGLVSFTRLSRLFGVRPWAIEGIVKRGKWKHV